MVIDIVLENGKSLKLASDVSIEWVQENMFFEDDVKLRGKYSFPFAVNRRANSDALEWADVIAHRGRISRRSCTVYVGGLQFYKGQINILDWNDDLINIAISRDTEEVDTSQYIDEMELGDYVSIANHANRNADRAKYYPEVDYAFPQFYQYKAEMLEKYGTISIGQDFIIVNWQNGDSENADGKELAVPKFYLLSVLSKVFAKLGLSVRTGLFSDAFFKKVLIYNPITALSSVTNCLHLEAYTYNDGYGVVRMRDKLSCFSVPVGAVILMSVYEFDQYGQTNVTGVSHTVVAGDLVSISTFMTAIRTSFLAAVSNAALISEDYTVDYPAFTVQLTTGDEMLIEAPSATPPDFVTQRIDRGIHPLMVFFNDGLSYEATIKMQKHLPHITISSFLQSVKNKFNLAITIDEINSTIRIEDRKAMLSNANKPDYSDFLLDINEGAPTEVVNYKILFDHDADNDTLAEDLPTFADNYSEAALQPITEIDTGAGTLACESLRNSNSGFVNMPKVSQDFGDYNESVRFGLRFLYLNGYVADSNGQMHVNADDTGLTPNEIYTNRYQDWYNAIKRMEKAPTMYFNFGLDKLKSMAPGIWKVQHNDFMWKRITTVIHNTDGILVSKVEGYKL
jgi:hypothetical protein